MAIIDEIRSAIQLGKSKGWTIEAEEWCSPVRKCCCPMAACAIAKGLEPTHNLTATTIANVIGYDREFVEDFANGFDCTVRRKRPLEPSEAFLLGEQLRAEVCPVTVGA